MSRPPGASVDAGAGVAQGYGQAKHANASLCRSLLSELRHVPSVSFAGGDSQASGCRLLLKRQRVLTAALVMSPALLLLIAVAWISGR